MSMKLSSSNEAAKLQSHLKLLREEYVKLQKSHAELQKKYQVVAAANGENVEENFVSRLLRIIADLFDKDLYSDMKIKLKDSELYGHKFVLAARSDHWSMTELSNVSQLDLTDIDRDVGYELVKWIYTGFIDIRSNDVFLLDLLKVATRFSLLPLGETCEKALMSSVNVKNCIRYYQTSEEIGAQVLKEHCSELISNHWNDFTSEDFSSMPAPLAYKMFKSKSEHPLHTSIKAHREDVVFLYLMEFNALLPGKLNEMNKEGELALDLALVEKQKSIAKTLVEHKVDVNGTDQTGSCLLNKAISRGDNFSAKFLIENNANVNLATSFEEHTPLHLVASRGPEMAPTASLLLQYKADVNCQDIEGCTPMHLAIKQRNEQVFKVLLDESSLNTELQNSEGESVLWLALQSLPPSDSIDETSFAARLVKKGSSPDAVNPETGDSLLHLAARAGMEVAALFLTQHEAKINTSNKKGETPLHTACRAGLLNLTKVLLEKGSNPNAQTTAPIDENDDPVYKQTPLHIGICHRHKEIVQAYLDYKDKVTKGGNNLQIIPNFALKDSQDQTVLALALWTGFHDTASQLLAGGANINDFNSEGQTMLHQAIMRQDSKSALFLLERQADPNCRTKDGDSSLQLAIKRHLPVVVDALCKRGANMNIWDEAGDCALWQALESGQEDIASILVRHGCNAEMWHLGPGDCQQNLLHRAIDESNESVACFLIRSMDDVNSPRRPGPNGEGGEEARDGQTPLHLASAWALEKIVQALVEHNADVNTQDAEGKTPLHIAIENQHVVIISLLMSHPLLNLNLKDKLGRTPFATAMLTRNNKAAQMILDREPTAAEQFDNKGRNFLHIAVQNSDIESVLFLISVRANVNSKVNDSSKKTPLHIAAATGSEMIVRNLILAGANVNELTPQKQTALHFAASGDHATICQILIENHIDYDFVDENLNNALHIAVQQGHLSTVRVLLTESRINAEAVNARGQNSLHILGQYGKENAAAIFELFMECMPEYPINKPDDNGNTVLLLAYMNGNGNLCRAIVRVGAQLGNCNKEGLSIFNAPVATKQLLFKLLDMLSKEPPWCEGETCLECGTKFGIKTRKHHCRHCGRLLCSKCSDKDMPVIKYNIVKPTRVCEICFDVLTLGTGMS